MSLGSSLKFGDIRNVHPDRRLSPRYDMPGSVCMVEGDRSSESGRVRDISLNGCFVSSQQDVPIDQVMRLQFKIGADFEIMAIVCRKERSGFAVRFNGDPEQH